MITLQLLAYHLAETGESAHFSLNLRGACRPAAVLLQPSPLPTN
jgi:hypothetical protein